MPFCESCGAEIQAGKNFCSSCGAPLAGPALRPGSPPAEPVPVEPVPAGPQSAPPPAVPAPAPKPSRDKVIIAVVMVAAILGIVIFIGLPLVKGQGTTGKPVPGAPPAPSPAPALTTPPYMTPAASYPAASSSTGATVYRSGVAYEQVFAQDYPAGDSGVQDVFSYSLLRAPMIVECDLNPVIVSREQLVDIGKSTERYITSTYPDPNAWLDLKVINADTGSVVTTISFSKNYRGELKQTYTVRANGNYRFEILGVRVSPGVRLLVKQ